MSHFTRRSLLGGLLAAPAVAALPESAAASVPSSAHPALQSLPVGSMLVSTSQRRLYLKQWGGGIVSYPVAVGRQSKLWYGTRTVAGKFVRPAWIPPAEIRRDRPGLPAMIPSGHPSNPMGERTLTLSPGEYAIHGTNQPGSIGRYASYGCVRMHNHDIVDLYDRVYVGATLTMVP